MSGLSDRTSFDDLVWMLSRPPIGVELPLVESEQPSAIDDDDLVGRVAVAYRDAAAAHAGTGSFWTAFTNGVKRPIHEALLHDDRAVAMAVLRHPAENAHFWGFDAICRAPAGEIEPHENVFRNLDTPLEWKAAYARWLHVSLVALAEAVGAQRVFYPETPRGAHDRTHGAPHDVDALLDSIETTIGIALEFPNPYAGEIGLATKRGIVGFRSLQAIYQAWRVARIVGMRPEARILEIGAGLGRTAFYAHRLGLRDYTILDIPLTNAAQGYFLGRTLGPTSIALHGEQADAPVKVMPPEGLSDLKGFYDLVLNVDSLTELDESSARHYYSFARTRSRRMLSINHEFNSLSVRALYVDDSRATSSRHPYWMRRGYVEELIEFTDIL